jgi:intracellular septation protein
MPWVKLGLDFGPLALFFLVNSQYGIFAATATFMVAVVVALALAYAIFRKLAVLPLIVGVFVLLFGGLTLYLQDDTFIKIKATVVNLLLAALLAGGLVTGKPVLKLLLGEVLQMADEGWRKLTFRWVCFFVILALLNEVVWRNFSQNVWVIFKTFGVMPLTFGFMIAQVGLLQKYQASRASGESSSEEHRTAS